MRKFKSKVYGNIVEAESFLDVLKIAKKPIDGHAIYMWRGQSDISWPVHSSAYRSLLNKEDHLYNDNGQPTERSMVFYEEGLLDRATHRGFRQVGGRTLNDFELLARLQHHGAATRLLDASRNILVALFLFAKKGVMRLVYCLVGMQIT